MQSIVLNTVWQCDQKKKKKRGENLKPGFCFACSLLVAADIKQHIFISLRCNAANKRVTVGLPMAESQWRNTWEEEIYCNIILSSHINNAGSVCCYECKRNHRTKCGEKNTLNRQRD